MKFFHSSAVNPSKALSILVGSIPRSLGTTALLVGSWISLNDGVRVYCFFFQIFIRCLAVPAMLITTISREIPKEKNQ